MHYCVFALSAMFCGTFGAVLRLAVLCIAAVACVVLFVWCQGAVLVCLPNRGRLPLLPCAVACPPVLCCVPRPLVFCAALVCLLAVVWRAAAPRSVVLFVFLSSKLRCFLLCCFLRCGALPCSLRPIALWCLRFAMVFSSPGRSSWFYGVSLFLLFCALVCCALYVVLWCAVLVCLLLMLCLALALWDVLFGAALCCVVFPLVAFEAGSDPRGHLWVTLDVYLCAGKPPLADIILSHPPDLS